MYQLFKYYSPLLTKDREYKIGKDDYDRLGTDHIEMNESKMT